MPSDRPIYFSVDWDAGSGDWADIDAALRGAASVIGAARVGVYGSYLTVEHCRRVGTARWFWQTYAWSNGAWSPYAHIQQYRNGVTIGGADCDLNRAMQPDYGQWGYQEVIDVELTDQVYTAQPNNVSHIDPGPRTVGSILANLDTRTGWMSNVAVPALPDAQEIGAAVAAALAPQFDALTKAISNLAQQPPVQLSDQQVVTALGEALKQIFAPTA